jgi:hypothetical protein
VHLLGGFEPIAGDRFRIIDGPDGASLDGAFATLNLPPLANGTWNVAYGDHFVELQVVSVPEPATGVLLAAGLCVFAWRRATPRRRSHSRYNGQ